MYSIKPTKEKDINKVCKLMLPFPKSYPKHYVNSTKRGGIKWLLQYATKSKDKYDVKSYILELNKQIIGHVIYYKDVRCFEGGVYELRALVINSSYANKEYGKLLLNHIEKELKKINARMLWLQTDKSKYKFYLKQKYSLVGIYKNYWGKDKDRYVFSKNI